MMLPKVIEVSTSHPHSLNLTLILNKELFWFKGHFPIQAIFPGVAQIDLVMHYAKQYLHLSSFTGLDVIKFQRPLFPDEEIQLRIDLLPEKHKLTFKYTCINELASSGQISL